MVDYELVTAESVRPCERCGRLRPSAEFGHNGDSDICYSCRLGGIEEGKERKLRVQQIARHLAAEARGRQIDSPHIAEVNAGMFKLFGGVDGFCNAWFEQIQIAMETSPGKRIVLDQFSELAKLAKVATENRNTAPDVASLTDEELGREMLKLLTKAHIALDVK